MNQQINLYLPEYRPNEQDWSFRISCRTVLGVVGLCCFISAMQYWNRYTLQKELQLISATRDDTATKVERLENELKKDKDPDKKLVSEVNELQSDKDTKLRLLKYLRNESKNNTMGFSEYLTGFARYHVQGLWLKEIELIDGGEQLSISGETLKAETVPAYLQNLSNAKVFSGKHFSVFDVARLSEEGKQHILEFQIITQEMEK